MLLLTKLAFSQTSEFKQNEILLDLAGIGGYGALSYQKDFLKINDYHLSGRLGMSFFRFIDFTRKFNPDVLLPFSIDLRRQFKNYGVQIGVGQTFSSIVTASTNFQSTSRQNTISGSLILGFNYIHPNKRMTYRIFYSPIFQQYNRYRHWGGMSIGFRFKK